jgi:hypothetical protein
MILMEGNRRRNGKNLFRQSGHKTRYQPEPSCRSILQAPPSPASFEISERLAADHRVRLAWLSL